MLFCEIRENFMSVVVLIEACLVEHRFSWSSASGKFYYRQARREVLGGGGDQQTKWEGNAVPPSTKDQKLSSLVSNRSESLHMRCLAIFSPLVTVLTNAFYFILLRFLGKSYNFTPKSLTLQLVVSCILDVVAESETC